jgi:hypothetical protein
MLSNAKKFLFLKAGDLVADEWEKQYAKLREDLTEKMLNPPKHLDFNMKRRWIDRYSEVLSDLEYCNRVFLHFVMFRKIEYNEPFDRKTEYQFNEYH